MDWKKKLSTGVFSVIFGSPRLYSRPRTPVDVMTKNRLLKQEAFFKAVDKFQKSRTGQFIGGAWNFTTGTVGTIASVAYIIGSSGTGAILGGAIALQFSLAEMAIGTTQMIDAAFAKKMHDKIQNPGSITGLISYGVDSKYAAYWDALGQFTPTMGMSGGVRKINEKWIGSTTSVRGCFRRSFSKKCNRTL